MSALNVSSFIWGIADDVLRDVYVRGKYRDAILPMTVIRRLDAVLEPTKAADQDEAGHAPGQPHRRGAQRQLPFHRRRRTGQEQHLKDKARTMRYIDQSRSERVSVDPLDIARRLTELKGLNDGWADGLQPAGQWGEGYGKAPPAEGLDWLAEQFRLRYAPDLLRPYLYPTPEGGVHAE